MIDQSKRLAQPLRWTHAGRWAVIATAASLLAAVAVVAAIALGGGSSSRRGCIEVTYASTLGGATMHACGSRARDICAAPAENPAAAAGGVLRDACRRARLPYGTG
jgi:hypothetical protein